MKFSSFFSGIGEFDLGLERAGMECVGQVEIDPYRNCVLGENAPSVMVCQTYSTIWANGLTRHSLGPKDSDGWGAFS